MYALILFQTENVSIHWARILKEKAKTVVKNCNACVVVCVADNRNMPTNVARGLREGATIGYWKKTGTSWLLEGEVN
jgi:hypothetical protein